MRVYMRNTFYFALFILFTTTAGSQTFNVGFGNYVPHNDLKSGYGNSPMVSIVSTIGSTNSNLYPEFGIEYSIKEINHKPGKSSANVISVFWGLNYSAFRSEYIDIIADAGFGLMHTELSTVIPSLVDDKRTEFTTYPHIGLSLESFNIKLTARYRYAKFLQSPTDIGIGGTQFILSYNIIPLFDLFL
jgi:hypothetical protein